MSILEIIQEIIAKKRKAKNIPDQALLLEIVKRYKEAHGSIEGFGEELDRLVRAKVIFDHPTANSTAYTMEKQ